MITRPYQPPKKLRGVNLGGWLVLEKWMTPSLFAGLKAEDETSYCRELGTKATPALHEHWQQFITREDFSWLANIGINAVRIPIGHWLFGPDYPYHPAYGSSLHPYVEGGLAILDQAFDWAEDYGLAIVLDLHAAPGCQNGFDNGGILNVCEWHTKPEYIEHSLNVLERLSERYHRRPSLHAIEVLNEPHSSLDTALLKQYTTDAYQRIRKYCPADQVAVVFHDGFRSFRDYSDFLCEPDYSNIILDIHRYQCFGRAEQDANIYDHIRDAVIEWQHEANDIITEFNHAAYVGEWSLGMDYRSESAWSKSPFNYPAKAMDNFQTNLAFRGYAAAQLLTFEKYLGWFFWSYKTETMAGWSFKDCVANGWLPNNFNDEHPNI